MLAYLLKPITQLQLEPTIAVAMRRHAEVQLLKQEAGDLRLALLERCAANDCRGDNGREAIEGR